MSTELESVVEARRDDAPPAGPAIAATCHFAVVTGSKYWGRVRRHRSPQCRGERAPSVKCGAACPRVTLLRVYRAPTSSVGRYFLARTCGRSCSAAERARCGRRGARGQAWVDALLSCKIPNSLFTGNRPRNRHRGFARPTFHANTEQQWTRLKRTRQQPKRPQLRVGSATSGAWRGRAPSARSRS